MGKSAVKKASTLMPSIEDCKKKKEKSHEKKRKHGKNEQEIQSKKIVPCQQVETETNAFMPKEVKALSLKDTKKLLKQQIAEQKLKGHSLSDDTTSEDGSSTEEDTAKQAVHKNQMKLLMEKNDDSSSSETDSLTDDDKSKLTPMIENVTQIKGKKTAEQKQPITTVQTKKTKIIKTPKSSKKNKVKSDSSSSSETSSDESAVKKSVVQTTPLQKLKQKATHSLMKLSKQAESILNDENSLKKLTLADKKKTPAAVSSQNQSSESSSSASSENDTSSDEDEDQKVTLSSKKTTLNTRLTTPSKTLITTVNKNDNLSSSSDDSTSSENESDSEHKAQNKTLKNKKITQSAVSTSDEDSETPSPTTSKEEQTNDDSNDNDTDTDADDDADEDADEKNKFVSQQQIKSRMANVVSSICMDPNVEKIWKCRIDLSANEPSPIWEIMYTKQPPALTGPFCVEIGQEETPEGLRPILKLKKTTTEDFSIKTKKRIRTEDFSSQQQPAKKQFGGNDATTKHEIFVGNLPFGTTENELKELFEESCGEIERIKILSQGGAAFIAFATQEGVTSALEWNQSDYNGRKLNINLASEKPAKASGANRVRVGDAPPNSTVIVRNIPYSTQKEELKTLFSECGNVVNVNLPTFQDTGKLRGFGVVNFSNPNEAAAAVQLSGTEFSGRVLTIEIAYPRDSNAGRGRGSSTPRSNFQGKGRGRQAIRGSHQLFND